MGVENIEKFKHKEKIKNKTRTKDKRKRTDTENNTKAKRKTFFVTSKIENGLYSQKRPAGAASTSL